MVMGVCLVFLIQWLFLGDLRSALIVSATIPFALLFAVVIAGAERGVGQPAVDGRHRLRHHRRRHRHHGREHLPPPRRDERRARAPRFGARRAARPHRQGRHHLPGIGRGHAGDLLLGHHHHRRLPAAVHPVGRRGSHLRADGQDLRLRAVGRPARHLHRLARARRRAAAVRKCRRPRRSSCARLRRLYRRVIAWRARPARPHAGGRRGPVAHAPPSPPAPSGSSSCPSSRRATSGCARRCRRRCRSTRAMSTPIACAGWSRASPRSRRSSPSTAGPTTAPIPTASPTSSSSCR